jgi:hypothetical protein
MGVRQPSITDQQAYTIVYPLVESARTAKYEMMKTLCCGPITLLHLPLFAVSAALLPPALFESSAALLRPSTPTLCDQRGLNHSLAQTVYSEYYRDPCSCYVVETPGACSYQGRTADRR